MRTRTPRYGLGPEDVGIYLIDLEIRWGVKVGLELRMKRMPNRAEVLCLHVTVPEAIHRRELDFVPDVHRVIGKSAAVDYWSECWAALYDFDHALAGGNNY